jgi:hypothetical protein
VELVSDRVALYYGIERNLVCPITLPFWPICAVRALRSTDKINIAPSTAVLLS